MSPAGGPTNPFWTALTPRLPYWSRLWFRLQSAADQNVEADPLNPPICGFLMPDLLEHALEVFDGNGKSIGQLSSDLPQFGSTGAVTLNVKFEVDPWVAADRGMGPGSDPLTAIDNPTLRAVVAGILAQKVDVPAKQDASLWFESGLTALLRVVDTVRGTIDPSFNSADRKLQLLGEPILVLGGRVQFETTAPAVASTLRQDPPPLATPPALPVIPVRIGDITRPDDGVLGCFIPGATAADSRFAPVSKDCADHAVLSSLTVEAATQNFPNGQAVTHPFIKDQTNEFQVPGNGRQDLIILADIRGALYATCGVLPRKKIVIPKEFVDAGLQNLEPSFAVGPILAVQQDGGMQPYLPPPKVDGYNDEFIYRQAGAAGAADTYPSQAMLPLPQTASLPPVRAMLQEGWVRLTPAKKKS
jgi:hypothetical protein